MQVCFATNNAHKLREVQDLLGSGFSLISPRELGCVEELPEEGDSFEANSRQKATYLFDRYQVPCFADDSGLVVAALDGAPGVYSARYAGPEKSDHENLQLLLRNMQGKTDRRARFETVITYVDQDGSHQFKGTAEGVIIREPRGEGGFGYDPVFLPDGYFSTFAEMTAAEKNAVSHRGLAIRKLVSFLKGKNAYLPHHG